MLCKDNNKMKREKQLKKMKMKVMKKSKREIGKIKLEWIIGKMKILLVQEIPNACDRVIYGKNNTLTIKF